MFRQFINGSWVNSVYATGSADDLDAIKSLLEGRVEEWDLKQTTGSSAELPTQLNPIRMRCGRKSPEGTFSCVFKLAHIDPAKNEEDVKPLVIGKFASSYKDDTKAEYCEELNKH